MVDGDAASTRRCSLCAPGSYTPDSGNTQCLICTAGYLCVEGSSSPQPCSGGTHANQSILATMGFLGSLSDCVACPRGTFCPVGTNAPSHCAAGTYTDQVNAATCVKCSAGSYQDAEGATSCKRCSSGNYCKQGTAEPVPCPAGYVGDAMGLYSPMASPT